MIKKQTHLKKIKEIADSNDISLDDIKTYYAGMQSSKQSFLPNLFSYLGGALLFSGICIYTGMMWDELSSASRVTVTLGAGIFCLIMALVAINDGRYKRAFTPMMLMAAVLQPIGIFTFFAEYIDSNNDPEIALILVFGVMALQQSAVFHKYRQTSPAFYAILFGYSALFALFELINIDTDISLLVLGLSGLCLAYGVSKTPHRVISEFGYFISTLSLASGAFELFENSFDIALIGIAAALIYTSVWAQSRTFLFMSICTLLGYLSYYTSEYFSDLAGWPIALMVMGVLFIGVSSLGVKLGQKIKK